MGVLGGALKKHPRRGTGSFTCSRERCVYVFPSLQRCMILVRLKISTKEDQNFEFTSAFKE